jgi:hypothetical protein
MEARRFNAAGIRAAEVLLAELGSGTPADPKEVVLDAGLTELVGVDVEIRSFLNRREAADYFYELLSPLHSESDVSRDKGLWTWLALAWIDLLAPESNGERKTKEPVRWILAVDDYRKYARHLLAGPYYVAVAHEGRLDDAMAVLAAKVEAPGELVAQLTTRYEIVRSPGLLEAATRLYCTQENRSVVKPGAAGKGPGSARRFAEVFKQFELTWDLFAMTADEVIGILPSEFDRFKP